MCTLGVMAVSFERIAPVFASLDVARALRCYQTLGFDVDAFGDGDDPIYGFIRRGPVEIHIARVPYIDMKTTNACCYLWVDDADALYAEWLAANTDGTLHPAQDTSYGLREFGYVDRDGNLIRVGSSLDAAAC